jgi:hypothetical protein
VNSLRLRASAVFSAALLLVVPLAASARDVAVSVRPDVLVVGGTPAGVAAAVAAAGRGEDVTLVASGKDLGGVLTGAMMDQWDLNVAPDSDAAAIQGGIFGEIYADLGDVFTPADAARTFADLVAAQPRITVRYGESPVAVQTTPLRDGSCIDDVTFRNARTGALTQISAPYVVDATDFGDVAALAGAPYDLGRQDSGLDDRMQAVTLMFTIDGVNWDALAASYDPQTDGPGGALARRAWGYSKVVARYDPLSPNVLVRDLNLGRTSDGAVSVNAIDVVGIDGLRARDLAEARGLAEREAGRLVAFLRARLPGFAGARVGQFAPDLYVRETRHFAGLERLTTADVWLGKIPADTIGLSSYPIDLHPVDASDTQPFAPVRHIYGIPFGAMVPRGIVNLVLAGPAISASHLASGSARVIPTTIEEGEAAGAAAADADRAGIDFVALATRPRAIAALRRDLGAHDVVIALPASLRDASPTLVARRADAALRPT